MPDLLLREVWDVPVVLNNILGPKNEIKILYNTVVDNRPPLSCGYGIQKT
jgi:hypothetical protein